MIETIQRFFGIGDYAEERLCGATRSPQWPTVRAAHLKDNPTCIVCGGTKKLNVHHILVFHLNPADELNPKNLCTLCEGSGNGNHHLLFGHLGNFKSWNKDVIQDSATWLQKIQNRPE